MQKYIIGNWKMELGAKDVHAFVANFQQVLKPRKVIFGIAAPFVFIDWIKSNINTKKCMIGAENVCEYQRGAYTGEVSASMLKDIKTNFCIVGHSERRHIFNETNAQIREKIVNLIDNGIAPLLCIGETLKEYEEKQTTTVLKKQLTECLAKIPVEQLKNLIVAYEPVWAIGTGKTATSAEIEKCIKAIKQKLQSMFGENTIPVLYGGSVKPANAEEILNIDVVDGALIGGASLKVNSFIEIAKAVK